MKRIVQQERVEYINDFTGKVMEHGVPVTLIMEFGYGSSRDGDRIELHLDDEHVDLIMKLIREHRKVDIMLE